VEETGKVPITRNPTREKEFQQAINLTIKWIITVPMTPGRKGHFIVATDRHKGRSGITQMSIRVKITGEVLMTPGVTVTNVENALTVARDITGIMVTRGVPDTKEETTVTTGVTTVMTDATTATKEEIMVTREVTVMNAEIPVMSAVPDMNGEIPAMKEIPVTKEEAPVMTGTAQDTNGVPAGHLPKGQGTGLIRGQAAALENHLTRMADQIFAKGLLQAGLFNGKPLLSLNNHLSVNQSIR
jgi:hypothetical protein